MTGDAALGIRALAVEQVLGRFMLRACDGCRARREQGAGEREAGNKVAHRWQ